MTSDELTPAQIKEDLRAEICRVHEDSYGTGATQVQVLLEEDLIVMVLDIELTRAEQTLVDAGRQDAVKTTREEFQKAIGPTFNAIVERATGRRVTSFLSAMSVDPLYSVELFRLSS